jgi:hypothetical protein
LGEVNDSIPAVATTLHDAADVIGRRRHRPTILYLRDVEGQHRVTHADSVSPWALYAIFIAMFVFS